MKSTCIIDTTTKNEDILLTIAIPTFRRFELLKETLNSVFNLYFHIPVEVIVVDNDPESGNVALMEMKDYQSYEFKYYKNEENYGMFDNWNQCVNLAAGKYITLLHDDDLLSEEFASQVNKLLPITTHDIIGFDNAILDQRDVEQKSKAPFLFETLKVIFHKYQRQMSQSTMLGFEEFFWCNIFSGTLGVVILREKAIAINFDKKMYPIADYDFWLRWISQYGKIFYVPKIVGFYRIRENESFKPAVIAGFITKNKEMRMRTLAEKKLGEQMSKYVNLLENVDKYNCNYLLRSKEEFSMSWFITLKYLILKIRIMVAKKKTKNIWY